MFFKNIVIKARDWFCFLVKQQKNEDKPIYFNCYYTPIQLQNS